MPLDARTELAVVEADGHGVTAIDCGSGHHARVTPGGDLRLDDHDVDAELALLAFGSAVPTCLVYLAIWEQAVTDPWFLLAWGDDVDASGLQSARETWHGNDWESWPTQPSAARVLFGPRLQCLAGVAASRRAVATDGDRRADAWQAAERATSTRARQAFLRSLAPLDAHPRPDALVPLRIRLDGDGGGGRVAGRLARLGSGIDLVLPPDWLATVWEPGLTDADRRFVLSRAGDDLTCIEWRPSGGPDNEHLPHLVVVRR